MLTPLDIIFLFFVVITLYFSFLILGLYIKNKKKLFDQPKSDYFPSVSIIVPAYNEERTIRRTIFNIKKLEYPKKIEIIVVDHESTDRTLQILRSIKGIKVVRKKRVSDTERKAHALNYGIKHAKGEVIVCVDADSYPSRNALINSVPFLDDKEVGAITTSIFVENPKTALDILQGIEYSMIVWARKLLEFVEGVYVTPGPFSLYRKSALKKIKGFDEDNLTEDIEIAWRLMFHGYKIRMATNTSVKTSVPNDFVSWWKQRLRWNVGGLETCLKYKFTFLRKKYGSLGLFVVPFFALSFVIAMLGFGVFSYLIFNNVFRFIYKIILSFQLGVIPQFELILLPNVFWIFGFLIMILSLIGVKIGLSTTKNPIRTFREYFCLLIYISLYITIFPIVLIHSFYNILRKKKSW